MVRISQGPTNINSRARRQGSEWSRVLLALSLSIFLIASVIPFSHFADAATSFSFKAFSGQDHVNVSSTPGLQLSHFVVEVRLRTTQSPDTIQYIVSKGAGNVDSRLFDHNYALFMTKEGKLAGGFEAADGTNHVVYSDRVIEDTGWNTVRLVYDGIRLKLKFEGITEVSKLVDTKPDISGIGPLRIGANANNPLEEFFVGDIDYVKILDGNTFKAVYVNNFGDAGGIEPAPEPAPEPSPEPAPNPDGADCSEIPMSKLRGAVFMDTILGTRENGGSVNVPANYVSESMKYIRASGMNFVRVPYYWEAYVHDPSAFLNELEVVAKAAEANNICVVFANFHWYTTSYWDIEVIGNSDGRGFPSFVVKNFPVRNNNYDDSAGPFWNSFLSNNIFIDGRSVWDVQSDFFGRVILRVDRYDSVAGYEIMNEPHLFASSQYEKLGNYHTHMAKKIRDMTDKKIFFNREVTRDIPREPSLEYKIVPRGVSGLVYEPHLYASPTPGSQGEKQLENFYRWSQEWGIEVMVGEWGADTQSETDLYLKGFKDRGFGWTYYAWKPGVDRGEGNTLYDSSRTDPTLALKQLAASISKNYRV